MSAEKFEFDTRLQWRLWGAHASSGRSASMNFVLLISFAVCILSAWFAAEAFGLRQAVFAQEIRQRQALQRLTDPANHPVPQHRQATLKPDERKALNRVVRHLNTPWPTIFETVERLTPLDVAIVRLEPGEKGVLTIEAEALSIDKVLAFAGALVNQGIFSELALQRHTTNELDPNKPVRLSFQLSLKEHAR